MVGVVEMKVEGGEGKNWGGRGVRVVVRGKEG